MSSTVTATFVFTDLVGSTELLSRVGEVEADELRREHFGLLRKAIEQAGGREVKNLGDGLMVVFDGVASALDAAVAMQQAITARPVESEPLSITIGVAVGDAELEDDDYFGLPVVEAARLCAKAEGGEILTTEFVRMLARSRSKVELESIGALELKGLDEPVETYRVRWAPLESSTPVTVPLPKRLSRTSASGLVGRARERDRLDTALKEAEQGERRAVLIGGEPGIGKTTTTTAFAVDAAERGAWVCYGRCDEDLFIPYQPWVEALRHLVEHAPAELLAAHVDARGLALARLAPALATRTGAEIETGTTGEDESDRHVMFDAVVDLLRRAGEHAPVVVVLDDLHWADLATVQLLRHVLGAVDTGRLVVVGTYRDSEVGPGHLLADTLAALHREPGVERLALRGLGDDELLAMLEQIAGHEMGDDGVALRDVLARETEGNPFFVGEMLRHLAETGTIYQDETGRWVTDTDVRNAGLPVSIREVVGRRVDHLGPDTTGALTMAAVIGRDFDLALLERVVDLDSDALLDLCDAAVAAAVLRETDVVEHYTFAHALIEHTLYDGLSAARRARAHRAVAEALEALCGDRIDDRVGELAYHWAQATRPQDAAKAVEYARLAGDRAMTKLAPADAQRWYGDALSLLDEADDVSRVALELRIGVGEAQKLGGDRSYRDTLVAAARDAVRMNERDLAVHAALASGRGTPSVIGIVDTDRVEVVRAALDIVGPGDSRDRALLLGMLAAELHWGSDPAQPVGPAEEAIAIADRLGDPATFITVVFSTSDPLCMPDKLTERARNAAEATRLAAHMHDPALRFRAHWVAGFAAVEMGDRDALEHHVPVLEEAARACGVGWYRQEAALQRALLTFLDGDTAAMEQAANRVLEVGAETGQGDTAQIWAALMLNRASIMGELADLVPMIEAEKNDNPGITLYEAAVAWGYAWAGDVDHAAELVAKAREHGFQTQYNAITWLLAHVLWADAVRIVGDAAAAAMLCPRLEPWLDVIASPHSSWGLPAAYAAGIVRATMGDHDIAIQHLQRAIDKGRSLRCPWMIAQSEVALAEVLAERNRGDDRARASEMAESALTAATAGGYGYIESDARTVLNQLG